MAKKARDCVEKGHVVILVYFFPRTLNYNICIYKAYEKKNSIYEKNKIKYISNMNRQEISILSLVRFLIE